VQYFVKSRLNSHSNFGNY